MKRATDFEHGRRAELDVDRQEDALAADSGRFFINRPRDWLSEGAVIGIASAYAYMVAYAYQAGSAAYFAIPYQLVSVDLTQAFVAAVVLYFSLAWVLMGVNMASPLWHRAPKPMRKPIQTVLVFVLPLMLIVAVVGDARMWWLVLGMAALTIAGEFALPLATQRQHKNYLDKLAAANAQDEPSGKKRQSLLETLVRRAPRTVALILSAAILLGLFYLAGYGHSRAQTVFLVWPGIPERAAVYTSSSRIIFADFDRKTGTCGTELTIIQVPSDAPQTLYRQKLGRLAARN
jgi:hypothetical protein